MTAEMIQMLAALWAQAEHGLSWEDAKAVAEACDFRPGEPLVGSVEQRIGSAVSRLMEP